MTDPHAGAADPFDLAEEDEAPARGGRSWKKIVLGVLVLGAITAGLVWGGHFDFETLKAHRAELLAYTREHYAAMLVGVLLVYTLATAISFPMGIVMTFAVGFLFGRWVGTAIVVLAASVGATLAFLSARYLFADAVQRRMGPRLKRLARGFEQDAFNYILFVRLVPVFPFWLMNLVPAFTPVSARTFFVATLIGILPGTFVFANVGESLARIDSPRDLVGTRVLVSLALLGAMSLVPILIKKLRTRKAPLMADISIERAPRRTPLALAALALAVIALLMLLLSGPGTRFGMWHFRTGFQLMRYAAYAGVAAAVLGLIALVLSRGRGRVIAAVALLLGALTWFLPWNLRRGAGEYPPIHDITTDTRNPPTFVAVAPLRADASNPVEYAGDSAAVAQQQAYPDLRPMMMAMPVDSAFSLALRTAREMGWELVDQNRRDGRIEATATTPFFGFKDDVVIRVSSASGISRVDVRSKSRVGRGDVGANAKRIRAYLQRLRAADPNPIGATQ